MSACTYTTTECRWTSVSLSLPPTRDAATPPRRCEVWWGTCSPHRERISAECDARNLRSARLLARVGFHQEGRRRANTWIKGEWTDDLLFGLLANEWRTSPPYHEPMPR